MTGGWPMCFHSPAGKRFCSQRARFSVWNGEQSSALVATCGLHLAGAVANSMEQTGRTEVRKITKTIWPYAAWDNVGVDR